ncbi:MAG: Gfo/Idh/MocA family oxidoreductase, partial [Gammaproteobacteria bacterium]|nr:Gfo/Idh/MocA family oxidoreductase [Gammaproteobacteria bacterium]
MTTNWGILATGRIAHTFAGALSQSHTGQLVAVGSRSRESAEKFASTWGNVTAHATYQELIDDTEIDAIYVSTPHPQHAEWTIKALNAGKAVLCEKPMALNHPEVMAMIEAAK